MTKTAALLAVLILCFSATAQDWDMPRTPDGQPDMQGIWSNASQTPLARPEEYGTKGFLNEDEAQAQMQAWRDRYDRQGQAIEGDRTAPWCGQADGPRCFPQ